MRSFHFHGALLLATALGAAALAACGSSSGETGGGGFTGSGSSTENGSGSPQGSTGSSTAQLITTGTTMGHGGGGGGTTQAFDVQPAPLQTITVAIGKTTPHVAYTATIDGSPAANTGWQVDKGNVGTVPQAKASSIELTPTGSTGGVVTVTAGLNGQTVSRQVLVKLAGKQNGADATNALEAAQIANGIADLSNGGGVGGVGGEGLGGMVDAATSDLLAHPTGDATAQALSLLYPYDKTVFPRGLLAPLLQWSWTPGDADAIRIDLSTTSGSFSWSGTFGKPAILATTGGKFIRHPIPQDIWDAATNTAGGLTPDGKADQLTVGLTVLAGGVAYGPMQQTWTVAPGRLAGTVYYNSYGTQLAKNSNDNDANGQQYGAAVLAIHQGATGPVVVAGGNTPGDYSGAGCRVCHVVAANGSNLVVQHGDAYGRTSSYDLQTQAETALTGNDNTFGWAALSPDGTLALTNAADLAAGTAGPSKLLAFPPSGGANLAVGLDGVSAGAPAFSPDGKHVAFDFLGGALGSLAGNGTQLVAMDFDAASFTFSNPTVLATMTDGHRAGFPSFFPTNKAVAYHHQLVNSGHRYNTWQGAQAQIWWSDLATGTDAPLSALNGVGADGTTPYLPTNGDHPTDTTLNYEPTVNPVVSGGYIWVVFTSRRIYGNVAVSKPWQSDPRGYNTKDLAQITTKKLWVAAVDVGSLQGGVLTPPAPGSDPSHPAFYLPAQELLAGNARAFWVLDPCRNDGTSCETGDQCCNGFCEPDGTGALVCSNTPPGGNCSGHQEHCDKTADCCDSNDACINGFCGSAGPH